jgi:hypothetical protein
MSWSSNDKKISYGSLIYKTLFDTLTGDTVRRIKFNALWDHATMLQNIIIY